MADHPHELRLLGTIELRGDAAASDVIAQSKLVALLAYLAASPGEFQRRDLVVALLWPELDQAHARAALRKALHALRHALGKDAVTSRGDEDVGIARDIVWCDVAEFTASCDAGRLTRALELYQGDFMPGFHLSGCAEFERWLDEVRSGARDRAGGAAWALAVECEKDRASTKAAHLARRAVRLVWGNERVLRRALEMLERLGDRAGALILYEEFARRLKTDLDAEPSAETVSLVQRLRA